MYHSGRLTHWSLPSFRYFFLTCLSATVGVLVILTVVMFIFIQHYLDPNSLRTAPQFDGKNQQSLTYLMYFVYPLSVINIIIYEWVCLWK